MFWEMSKGPREGVLTDVGEQHREEDEPVGGADQDDAQVHPEVEHLEDLDKRRVRT